MLRKRNDVATYHLSPKSIGRAQGKSAVAAAAYRAGEALTDERLGLSWDYTRKGGVLHTEIVAPYGSPAWANDRNELWNAVERAEDKSTRRDTAKTAREFEVSLPHELDGEQRQAAGLELARYLVDTYGVVADVAFHAPHREGDQRNWHVHIMTTTRVMTDAGFAGKVRELDSPKTSGAHIDAIRAKWSDIANRHLENAGRAERIDHRSFSDQGLDQAPTVHLGVSANAMERKGETTEVGDLNRDIKSGNERREALRAEAEKVSAEIVNLAEERAKRAAEKEIFASIRTHDPARVLDAITERRSTFTRADLNYALSKEITDARERSAFMNDILVWPEVVALRDVTHGPITRYTTRGVLAAEAGVLNAGRDLAQDTSHGITASHLANTLDHHSELDREQRAAVAHTTGTEGFAIIAGEAGTGKSRTMAAVRDAYEADGKRVIGMAWTNAVVQDMKADGFRDPTTIAAELMRQKAGRSAWNSDTVLIVDEAAMLATKHLAEVATLARDAGAKLILVGDDKQLASIERGGLFGALQEEHGAAELHKVRRVQDDDQKQAFNQMHRGEYREALGVFEERGAIRWTADEVAARAGLVAKYTEDRQADPERTRFAFAYTNKEVAALNADIRAKRSELGELGADHTLQATDGPLAFATGDRIQFTGSARKREDRAAGLVNGMVGTVREIDGQKVTVEIDTKAGSKPRAVSFTAGPDAEAGEFGAFRHGYAGTIYKGQGRTLDQTYLLHSKQWRSASSYVALTRHREDVTVFVDQSVAADLDKLARQMSRVEEKRAASQFHEAEQRRQDHPTPIARRYAALDAAHRKAQEGTGTQGEPTDAPADATAQETARRAAEAQRIAARFGRMRDAGRQAVMLQKAHDGDAGRAAPDGAAKPSRTLDDFLADIKKQVQDERKNEPERGRTLDRGRGRTR